MEITVVGAGVSGLTTSLTLAGAGHTVRTLTADPPDKTTSIYAAAIWYPTYEEPIERTRPWSLESLRRFTELAESPETGVDMIDITEFLSAEPVDESEYLDLPGGRRHTGELPPDRPWAYTYTAPRIDPTVYLDWLAAEYLSLGGALEVLGQPLDSLDGLEGDVIVNCTGLGAGALVDDTTVFPIRGQVVAVDRPDITAGLVHEETAVEPLEYVFPRRREVILGGTRQRDDWSRQPDPAITDRILRSAERYIGAIDESAIIETRVGLRPGRPEVRLELDATRTPPVIHNYGHAGNGYILSWGCSGEVATFVASL